MTQLLDKARPPVTDLDLAAALHRVLERSPEPLTPANGEPFTFATGRLFHADRYWGRWM